MSKNCPECNGRGFVYGEDGGVERCRCIVQKARDEAYLKAGIPRSLLWADLQHYNPTTNSNGDELPDGLRRRKEAARECIQEIISGMPAVVFEDGNLTLDGKKGKWHGRTVVLSGGERSGKSMLATAIVKAAISMGASPLMLDWSQVLKICSNFELTTEQKQLGKLFEDRNPIVIENYDLWEAAPLSDKHEFKYDTVYPTLRHNLESILVPPYKQGSLMIFTTHLDRGDLRGSPYGSITTTLLRDSAKILLPSNPVGDEVTIGDIN